MEESELVVHGLRAMLEPHSALITVVAHRADGPAPLCDLTLYEPHRRTAGVRPAPQRFPTRMVAFGWDCSPEAVSTEMSRGAAGFVSKWLPARRLVWNLLQVADGRIAGIVRAGDVPAGAITVDLGGNLRLAYHAWPVGNVGYPSTTGCLKTSKGCAQRRLYVATLGVT